MMTGTIALAGVPNSGKTALFNALTGSRQKVANYSGVTVEKKIGKYISPTGAEVQIVDLPGTYSLNPMTPDETITRDALFGKIPGLEEPSVLIAVVDATQLERNLAFVLELIASGKKIVLALNMYDLAQRRGMEIDVRALSRELGCPVIPTVAVRARGIDHLMEKVLSVQTDWDSSKVEQFRLSPDARFRRVDEILKSCIQKTGAPETFTHRMDAVLLHPWLGSFILITVLFLIFQAVFTGAAPLQDGIEFGFQWLGEKTTAIIGQGPLSSLIVDGVIAGVGGVVVFLPQILILFAFILFLEDFGYMARAAFLMDKLMGAIGLHGRAFLPLLSSFACAIPGIMATRTIDSKRDRLATILIAPLMTCSARLPVYALLISAFIPSTLSWGPFKMQGIVMLALYAAGVFAAIAVAFVLKLFVLKGERAPLLLELPTYKIPSIRSLLMGVLERGRIFLKRAGTVIVGLSILLWYLASYPKPPAELSAEAENAIVYSYAGQIGKAVEPFLAPIGFDWRMSVALIPGMAAREVMVSALSTVYSIENSGDDEAQALELGKRVSATWSLATALSILAWYVFAPQCLATLAVARRETGSGGWTLVMTVYLFVLAYAASFVTYHLTRYFS